MWQYNQSQELKHFGVVGMKWGKRKAGYTTVSQANRNAKNAMRTAYKESSAKDKANGITGIGSGRKRLKNARAGMEDARKESISNDRGSSKNARLDKKIGKIEALRKSNSDIHKIMNRESKEIYGDKTYKLNRSLAGNKALYNTSEVTNKFKVAKLQAKKDPNYKNSTDYKKAKADYSKQRTQTLLYGTMGHQRIETLKNTGYSEKRAKGETAALQAVAAIGTVGLIGAMEYLTKK